MQRILGKLFVVANSGCPTVSGLLLHSLVFGLIVYLIMVLQGAKKETFVSGGKAKKVKHTKK